MNADTLSFYFVRQTYHQLKRDFYYDKVDLFLRTNVAAYEGSGSFQKRQDAQTTIPRQTSCFSMLHGCIAPRRTA